MKDLIKAIRLATNMNQEQFASALGTTPLSINRWENGKTLPNRMAQTQLYSFCKEHSIDVAKFIVKAKAYANEGNNLVLYHGSKKGITGDIAPISREECDFGKGFYMGTSTLQPLTLILTWNFRTLQFNGNMLTSIMLWLQTSKATSAGWRI